MPEPNPSVSMANWHCLPEDTHVQLLINPTLQQLRVVGAPEYVGIATRFVVTSGEGNWSTPPKQPACCGLRLARLNGPVEIWEGALLSFNNQAFARLTNMGSPYWRQAGFPPDSLGFYSGCLNYLLSYCQLEFVDVQQLAEHELARALVLQATDLRFD